MALVPLIQPPIMKALTTDKERKIRMVQLRTVSKREKILFPAVLLLLVALLLPDAAPLLGMFCFGNLMRESGVVERLSDTVQNALINIVTIFLGMRSIYAGWRHKCLIRPTFLPAGSPPGPASAAPPGRTLQAPYLWLCRMAASMPYPAYVPSHRLTPPRTGKRSAAGRSGSIPAVVPDGGIHALSGL
ncbi:sodium ion-translocating decarboxylase subunit beta [Klebsiella pneumoniae]|nr:sodium ion-translocating decarboxylase subunit beta [Klebsiella pneumoniae]